MSRGCCSGYGFKRSGSRWKRRRTLTNCVKLSVVNTSVYARATSAAVRSSTGEVDGGLVVAILVISEVTLARAVQTRFAYTHTTVTVARMSVHARSGLHPFVRQKRVFCF